MEEKMFCFQCQETAKGSGCTVAGVCGKKDSTAARMDLLLFVTRGVSVLSNLLRNNDLEIPKEVNPFVCDALFSTITNANFDEAALERKIRRGFELRSQLTLAARHAGIPLPDIDEIRWQYEEPLDKNPDGIRRMGVMRHADEDIRSLTELITYGLKGMAAYVEHARHLGFWNAKIDAYIQQTLSDITTKELSADELLATALQTGEIGLQAMSLLDHANTSAYGHPSATEVSTGVSGRPGILVSGHDLRDLEMLLEQSAASGIDVYTHGEMLPANSYPRFKKHPHLAGNYGGAWWRQRDEFESFNGPVLLTSNCIVPPPEGCSYKERLFTTNAAGYPGCTHIEADACGRKDFMPLIRMAEKCPPPAPLETGTINIGHARGQLMEMSRKLAEAISDGRIRRIVVMAGCDGRMRNREYYTDFARHLPEDCVIMTAGCAKYRYNKLGLGQTDGIPRVLDAGQCNDCYSIVMAAMQLRDLLGLEDINRLPVYYNIAWYEQKAVIVLLALLASGIRNIHLGPTLPAFCSPNVLNILKEKFGLDGIRSVPDDLNHLFSNR